MTLLANREPELAPVLEVSLELVNDTEETFYLVEEGSGCTPFGIRRDGMWLSAETGFHCGCECNPPGIQIGMVSVAPMQSLSLSWDGRALATYTRHTLCEEKPFPQRCISETDGSPQPLEPGSVEVVIPVLGPDSPLLIPERPRITEMCPGEASFSIALELEGDDISVQVPLSTIVLN
ncbi:MAG: hypothetical protein KUG77_00300 [Nannocystaceae bacterium]|nr:hypothetical protein [Nannocystaceae bacterium]